MTQPGTEASESTEGLAQRLAGIELFAGLDAAQLGWLAEAGRRQTRADGEVVFRDGERADCFYVVLEGGLLVTTIFAGQEQVLNRLLPSDPDRRRNKDKPPAADDFIGELPLLTGTGCVGTGTTLGPTVLLAYDRQAFFSMLERCPKISRVLMPVLAWRIQVREVQAGRSVMLAGLNTLAAGLTHELSNPMAAAVRGSSQLRQVLDDLIGCSTRWGGASTPSDRESLAQILSRHAGQEARCPGGPLAVAEIADAVDDWLTEHDLQECAKAANVLADRGLGVDLLTELADRIRPESLAVAIEQLALELEAGTLVDDIADSARRVEEVVLWTKDYTNLDRAPEQEVDLSEGLVATLALLGPQLEAISVHRDFGDLPAVPVFPSEINQVWMSLLQNAVDAMPDGGDLTIRTRQEGGCAVIEICDTGSGIEAEVLPYIFQPFFTTKEVNRATGLGLHLSRETVTARHGGSIEVTSEPGDTRVVVRLPCNPRPSAS